VNPLQIRKPWAALLVLVILFLRSPNTDTVL